MNGYMGKILRVNLTSGQIQTEPLDPQLARDYIGGTGLGVRLAYDEIPPECDPLGPENKVMILTGPLTATRFPTSGRYQVVYKSPLTGILCDSSSGGHWAADFKKAGFDALIIEGASDKPVYLFLKDGQAELRDAAHLWGKDCFETQTLIQNELGDSKIRVACIGPAGERGSLHACLINDDGRAPGRGGNGAVLGAKKLKAIAVRGTLEFPLADPDKLAAEAKKMRVKNGEWPINEGWATLPELGTAMVLDGTWDSGDIPVKNWQVGEWKEGCLALGGQRMADTILTRRPGCYRCPIACARWVKVQSGPYAFEGPGPEYETLGAFGTMTLCDNLEAVAYAGHLCNLYGVDTISTGTTIAWAIECYEKGLLTKEDTDGIELKWGDADALVKATEKVVKGEGKLGELLSQGMRRAAVKVGGGAIDFACQVKGLEAPMHDPRAYPSLAATYAAGPRGACHLHGASMLLEFPDSLPEWGLREMDPDDKVKHRGKIAKVALDLAEVINSEVVCCFAPAYFIMTPDDHAMFLNAATGFGYTGDELHTIGDRIATLHRAYNNRCGIGRADDRLAPRHLLKTKEGGAKGFAPDVDAILDEFYAESGWDADGKPTPETLKRLGLEFAVADLHG